jgi:hypothetical protein
MKDHDDIRADLEPGVPDEEARALEALGRRLQAERAVPGAVFRGELRRGLLHGEHATILRRPRRLGLLIATYATAGCALLGVAALGVAGVGPLAAEDEGTPAAQAGIVDTQR